MENTEKEKRFVILGKTSNGGGGGGGEGTVTSVGISVPTGLNVTGSPVTSSGTIQIGFANGYSIPTTAKQSEWDAKSDFSGDYNDLTNKPTIPTVGNGTITITQGGVTKGTFTTNQSGNSTITLDGGGDVTADGDNTFTGTNTFMNDVFIGGSSEGEIAEEDYHLVINSVNGSTYIGINQMSLSNTNSNQFNLQLTEEWDEELQDYNLHTDIETYNLNIVNPTEGATASVSIDGYQVLTTNDVATVATTGSYNDLTNKPTIPAAQVNSDWNASSGVSQILNKPSMSTETLTFIDDNNVSTTVVVYTQPTV